LCGEPLRSVELPVLTDLRLPCFACPNECDGGQSVAKRVVNNSLRAFFELPSPPLTGHSAWRCSPRSR
jgi:hypothetical protein